MCHAPAHAAPGRTSPPKAAPQADFPSPPPRPRPSLASEVATDLVDAAASVARFAVGALVYYDNPLAWHHREDAYRENAAAHEARGQALAAAAQAQAQSGLLDPARPVAEAPDDGYWQCPRTHHELEAVTVAGLHAHVSRSTGGLMIERDSELALRGNPEAWPAWVQFARQLASSATVAVDGRAMVYLSCPTCGGPMVRKNFERVSGVMVDVCTRHGTWFDANELEQALVFLHQGGADKRRRFEDGERAHIDEQKQKIRDIEARLASTGRRIWF